MTLTTTQTTEVRISTALKSKLMKRLRVYDQLNAQKQATKAAMDKIKGKVENLFLDADEFDALQNGVKVEGFALKHVSGTRRKFNRKKFIDLGGSVEIYDMARPHVPTKAFMSIRVPGESEESRDDE